MDPAANYLLTTPGPDIQFNTCNVNQKTDCYFIQDVNGLDSAVIRNPVDNAPVTDGGLVHDFYEGPLHPTFSGYILIQSTTIGNSIETIRNGMVDQLRQALRSMLRADGTLSWTIPGVGAKSLAVRYDQALNITGVELLQFTFGLVSAASTPS
jgi:hypothetical protein